MQNLKIGIKLIGGFLLTACIILIVGVMSIVQQNRMAADTRKIVTESFPALENIMTYQALTSSRGVVILRTLLSPHITKEQRADIPRQLTEGRAVYNAARDAFTALPIMNEVQDEWREFSTAVTQWAQSNNQVLKLSQELLDMDIPNPSQVIARTSEISYAHENLVARVGQHLLLGRPLDKGTDINACLLTQWTKEHDTKNPQITRILDEIKPIHESLHRAVAEIKRLTEIGQIDEAKRLYANTVMPSSEKILAAMEEIRQVAGVATEKIRLIDANLLGEGARYQEAVAAIIDQIRQKTKDSAAKTSEEALAEAETGRTITLFLLGTGLLLAIALGLALTRTITKPLSEGVGLAQTMASGDLTRTLEVSRKDEIGDLIRSLNNMAANLRKMFGEIRNEVHSVDESTNQLAAVAEQVSSGAESTSGRSSQVAAAAEEMSANQSSIAAAMEQASVNINMVSSAAEEMNSTINEIASNSSRGKEIASEAVRQSVQASDRVNELGKAAEAITKVTEVITDISAQTNLLALNATIEAARAGEAGKGFAVVANEIKDLAKQTAEATLEIKTRIEGIQDATGVTVREINEIRETISDVDAIVTTIATAVEEQTATTREIAENISQASLGITEVNENVAQSSAVSSEIAGEIAQVNESANEMTRASQQVSDSAHSLSSVATTLKNMMQQFKI